MDFVLFDLGGVLCDVEHERSEDAWHRLHPGKPSIVESMHDSLAKPQADVGLLTAAGMAKRLTEHTGFQVTEAELRQVWGDMVRWRPFVPSLRARLNVPFGVLSTIDPIHSDRLGPLQGADPLVYSWEIGVAKPDLRAFKSALTRIPVRPGRVLYLDDLEENVRAATRCGMSAVRVTQESEIEEALRGLCADA